MSAEEQYLDSQPVKDFSMDRPATDIHPKVIASTVGAGGGAALAEIIVWLFERNGVTDLPNAAVTILVSLLVAFLAGWAKRTGFDPYAAGTIKSEEK